MKFFSRSKDGGPQSTVHAFWLCEIKSLFSIALLRFSDGSRDAYHSHAFDSISWVCGRLREHHLGTGRVDHHKTSLWPVMTLRETMHKVVSQGTTWVFTLRGPWAKTWLEFDPKSGLMVTLKHGREVVA